jgi:MFS family permease
VLTGFGPFVAVYLTSERWTQLDIGLVLTTGTLVALVGQMPGGALVDAVRSERLVAGLAITAIGASALAIATWPIFAVVQAAAVLLAGAGCVMGPAIAALSLGLVGHAAIGERLGRNARFASLGSGFAAIAMGATGYLISNQAVFFVTAAFVAPALLALSFIREKEIDPETAHGGITDRNAEPHPSHRAVSLGNLLRRRALVIFAACAMLFQLANAAMLPLVGSIVTMRSGQWATVLVAACIVVPQLVVAVMSPWVGRTAQRLGRRPFLLLGFAMVPIRGILFAIVTDPYLLVAVQLLDGITAAVFSVMVPLVVADVTRGTGRFNLSLGIVGTAMGIGASLSTTLAGYVSDRLGSSVAFLGLAGIAAAGLALVWALMPETRSSPPHDPDDAARTAAG